LLSSFRAGWSVACGDCSALGERMPANLLAIFGIRSWYCYFFE
jgi:hypothetical protein